MESAALSLLLTVGRSMARKNRLLGQDARNYDSMDGIGRVESGTETVNNAYVHGWTVVE